MITFHKRYSNTNIKDKYGKDQSDRFVCGADTHSGEWIQAWSATFPAPTLSGCPAEVARLEFTANSLESGLVPTAHKQMGGQGTKPIISKESDEETIRKAIEADRQSVKAAKAAWEASSGKTVSDETFRRFLSALVQDIDV